MLDCIGGCVSKKTSRLGNMPDPIQRKLKEINATKVGGYGIVRKYKPVQFVLHAIEWPVAMHGNNGISDHEMRTNRGTDVENAFVNSGPMQDILRPAVAATRHNTKHVFHAERDPGPVMRFNFGHGYNAIRSEDGSRKPQIAEAGIVGLKFRFDQFVAMEIHESELALRELVAEAGLVNEQIRVAMVSRTFPDRD